MPTSCPITHDEGMNEGKTVFSQLVGFLPDREFRRCVTRYGGDRYTKSLSCWEQFLAMAFAQLAYRESLRDIEACLGAIGPKLYHMGFSSAVARSTLADANESRDWRIFADFAQVLIHTAVKLYANDATGIPDVCMRWIRPPSIFAYCCFPGLSSASTRVLSKCTHCSICMDRSPPSSTSPTARWQT
jgi:hypothetical protein